MTSKVSEKLKSIGQSLWLGHLSRPAIRDGLLSNAVEDWSVTGAVVSPRAVCQGLSETDLYDGTTAGKLAQGLYGEALAYSEIIEDVHYVADLLRPLYDRTNGAEGLVVMPISPLSTNDSTHLVSEYQRLDRLVKRPNTLLCLPVTLDRLPLIGELVQAGVKFIISNVYSDSQYLAAANALLAGIERCLEAGLEPDRSLFVDIDIARLGGGLRRQPHGQDSADLALAMARKIYDARRGLSTSLEWERVFEAGVGPPRIVWSSLDGDGNNDIDSTLYGRLKAPDTVLALPHELAAWVDTQLYDEPSMSLTGSVGDQVWSRSWPTDLDIEYEADTLQRQNIARLSKEWAILLENFARKSAGVSSVYAMD